MKTRTYKSGTSWCFWRWTEVQSNYITRLHVIKTPWWAICVHWLNAPDPEPYMHDHPVSFLSIILRGGYVERRNDGPHARTWFNFIRASDQHTIQYVSRGGCVTLCFMGPKTREWGFRTPTGWVFWKDYNRATYK